MNTPNYTRPGLAFPCGGLLALLLLAAGAPLQAAVIDFTAGEGYSDGSIGGQPTGSPVWALPSGTAATDFVVDATAGSVGFGLGTNGRYAVYQSAVDFTTTSIFTDSIDFSFVQSSGTASNTSMLALTYLTGPTSGAQITTLAGGIGRSSAGTDAYRIINGSTASSFAGSLIGLDSGLGDNTSDLLRLSYELTRTATADTWSAVVTLTNLTTSSVVMTLSAPSITNATAYADSSLFAAMAHGPSLSTSNLSSLTVDTFNSPTAIPEPATWVAAASVAGLALLRRRRG